MNIILKGKNNNIAVVENDSLLITDAQSALDLAMTVGYETHVYNLVISKECITEDFFILSTRLAGEILQKYVNYGIRLAIVGTFSGYKNKPLHDFIYECNQGNDFFFVAAESEAVEKLEQSLDRACRRP